MRMEPVFLFDLDGTLVDSVYQHVLAWKEALDSEGVDLSVWRIHRKIGMSGGLFTNQLRRETGVDLSEDQLDRLRRLHAKAYRRMSDRIRPLPGARELLAFLTQAGLPWAIATSGRMETAAVNLAALGVDPDPTPVVTRDRSNTRSPIPTCSCRRGPIERADRDRHRSRRQHLGHAGGGALSRARGRAPLRRLWRDRTAAGDSFPLYEDPADLLVHIDELGGRR